MQTRSEIENGDPEQALARTIDELVQAFDAEPQALVPALYGEPAPEDVELVYSPVESHAGETESEEETAQDAPVPEPENLPRNFRCTLCDDRLYPVKRFYRPGRLPVLVLLHGGALTPGVMKRDRSNQFIFGSRDEDELFSRMLQAAGHSIEDLHYQEYLACHFNPETSTAEEWNQRGAHCLSHVRETVEKHSIRLLLLTGPAAILLLGDEKAREMSKKSETLPLPIFDDRTIPAMAIRSPAALIAMERKRAQARAAGKSEDHEQLVQQEKSIKSGLLAALKAAFGSLDV